MNRGRAVEIVIRSNLSSSLSTVCIRMDGNIPRVYDSRNIVAARDYKEMENDRVPSSAISFIPRYAHISFFGIFARR